MKLRTKCLGFEAGAKPIVILNINDAEDLGVMGLSRVRLCLEDRELTAIVNTTSNAIQEGFIGVYKRVKQYLNLKEDSVVEVQAAGIPTSLRFVINKLKGRKLSYQEIREIVKDVVEGNLSEIEIAALVTSLNDLGFDLDETVSFSTAMVETGEKLQLDSKRIFDKHSVGGVPGDKTTLIVVPIIAACGLTIPKTSSRAITSAAGTADRAEVLMPVDLGIEEMKRIVKKTNGCIIWGGSVHLAPADDIFIQIEHSLSIDPLLLPSIMSKKKAVGANFLVIDIPCGKGAKVKSVEDAESLAKDFIVLGKALEIKTSCAITFGEQPIGYAIGPALEAKESLEVLMGEKMIPDLVDKATDISAVLLEMAGFEDGKRVAMNVLSTGKAEEKLREIIKEQGGNLDIKPSEIEIGVDHLDIRAADEGFVLWINNHELAAIARAAGAPKDKGAGLLLHKKISDRVKRNDPILTIYAEKASKLEEAMKMFVARNVIRVGERMEMLIEVLKDIPVMKKPFIIDR